MKKSTLKAITGVSVLCVLVLALGAVSSWFTNWNTSTWFGRGGNNAIVSSTEDEPIACAYDDYGNDVEDGDILPEHMTFYRSSVDISSASSVQTSATSARASITLQALITPEDATVTNVEWLVHYVGGGSSGIGDYITATPLENKLKAKIECIQPFGTQIKIEVKVHDDFGQVFTAESLLDFLSVPIRIDSYRLSKSAVGVTEFIETVNNNGAPKFLRAYYSGNIKYHYQIYGYAFAWSVGTVRVDLDSFDDTGVNTYSLTKVTYRSPGVCSISASVDDPFSIYDIYWTMSGGKLTSENRFINYVYFEFANKYEFELLFTVDLNKPVDSVSIDNPSHVFE